MISSGTLYPPMPSYASGPRNPQPDGSFTLVANDDTGAVFSVENGQLVQKPKGTAGPNEKMWLNPGGGSVNVYADDGKTYCYQYDGRVA